MSTVLDRIADTLRSAAGDYLASGAVRLEVKTNLGPPITLYDGGDSQSLAGALGVKAALVVRRSDGSVIASYGEPPATDPVLIATWAVALAAIGALLVLVIRRV